MAGCCPVGPAESVIKFQSHVAAELLPYGGQSALFDGNRLRSDTRHVGPLGSAPQTLMGGGIVWPVGSGPDGGAWVSYALAELDRRGGLRGRLRPVSDRLGRLYGH